MSPTSEIPEIGPRQVRSVLSPDSWWLCSHHIPQETGNLFLPTFLTAGLKKLLTLAPRVGSLPSRLCPAPWTRSPVPQTLWELCTFHGLEKWDFQRALQPQSTGLQTRATVPRWPNHVST